MRADFRRNTKGWDQVSHFAVIRRSKIRLFVASRSEDREKLAPGAAFGKVKIGARTELRGLQIPGFRVTVFALPNPEITTIESMFPNPPIAGHGETGLSG